MWGILTTKTYYLTILALLVLHPASHGKSGRDVILRLIKYAQMFLHHFVCSVHFPSVQKITGIETIPHLYWENDKGVEPANDIQPVFVETLLIDDVAFELSNLVELIKSCGSPVLKLFEQYPYLV